MLLCAGIFSKNLELGVCGLKILVFYAGTISPQPPVKKKTPPTFNQNGGCLLKLIFFLKFHIFFKMQNSYSNCKIWWEIFVLDVNKTDKFYYFCFKLHDIHTAAETYMYLWFSPSVPLKKNE